MKVEGLWIHEAVKALEECRCDAIKPEGDKTSMILSEDGSISPVLIWNKSGLPPTIPTAYITKPCWLLINPRPITEPVEEKRWMWSDGRICQFVDFEPHPSEPGQWITVRYEREVPEPEVVDFVGEVTAIGICSFSVELDNPENILDLSGKRVRCIVED